MPGQGRTVTHFLGCSPSNPTVGTVLSKFYKGVEGRDAGRAMGWWWQWMQSQGTVAAWASDVVPASGRSPVGGAIPAMMQNTFRCHRLSLGLDEDVSRPTPILKLQGS